MILGSRDLFTNQDFNGMSFVAHRLMPSGRLSPREWWLMESRDIASNDMTTSPDPATDIKTSKHFSSKHKTSPPWNSRRLVHSKEMILASRWSVPGAPWERFLLVSRDLEGFFGDGRGDVTSEVMMMMMMMIMVVGEQIRVKGYGQPGSINCDQEKIRLVKDSVTWLVDTGAIRTSELPFVHGIWVD